MTATLTHDVSVLDYKQTLGFLYSRYAHRTGEDFEDIFQETWVDMMESGYPSNMNPLTAFIYRFRQINWSRYILPQRRFGRLWVSLPMDGREDEEEKGVTLDDYLLSLLSYTPSLVRESNEEVRTKIRLCLTEREWEVYCLLTGRQEYDQKQVASILGVSPQAINICLGRIKKRLLENLDFSNTF